MLYGALKCFALASLNLFIGVTVTGQWKCLTAQVTVWNTYILSSLPTPRAQWIKIKGKENLPPSLTFSRKRSFPVSAEKQIQTVQFEFAPFNGDTCDALPRPRPPHA